MLWPILVLVLCAWSTMRRGPAVKRACRIGIVRQIAQQLDLAVRTGTLPPWYYIFDLFGDEGRRRAACYLHRFETKGGLYGRLRNDRAGVPASALSNKMLFAQWCARHRLPHVPSLMLFENGALAWSRGGVQDLPPADLFAKPVKGRGGKGAARWDYLGDGLYRAADGTVLTGAQCARLLQAMSRTSPYVVQPRLVAHHRLRPMATGALSTARLLTCRDESGGYEVTDAVFRMACGRNHTVDNFHAGGIAAGIDIGTGVLGAASDLGLSRHSRWHDVHPDTGAGICGFELPFWPQACDLALAAHAVFCDRIAIGWDIALLDDGPCLVEGNGSPDIDIIQRINRRPLGDRRFGALLAFHLARLKAVSHGRSGNGP